MDEKQIIILYVLLSPQFKGRTTKQTSTDRKVISPSFGEHRNVTSNECMLDLHLPMHHGSHRVDESSSNVYNSKEFCE